MGAVGPGELVGATLRPPELEAEYRARFLRSDGRTAAVVAGGLVLLSAAYVANDARLADPSTFRALLSLRMATAAITVALVWAGIRSRRPAVLDAWCLAWVASSALFTAIVQSTRPSDYLLPVMGDLLLVVSAWTLIPNRFALQAIGAGAATAATFTWLVAFRDPPAPAARLLITNALLATNLAGGFVAWRLQRTRRLQFLAEREQAEVAARLRESRERLHGLLDASTDGYWERDLVTGEVLHSARMNEITGRPAVETTVASGEWIGRTHPDDLREVGPVYEAVLGARKERFDLTFRTRHADGSWRWVRSRGKVTARDGSGKPLRIAGTVTDVHAQRLAEEALRASEERHRSLIENLQAGVVVHGADTSVRLNNAQAADLLGLTSDQMRGKAAIDSDWRFVREDGTAMPVEEYPVNRVLATGRPVVDQVVGIERPRTGDRAWVIASGYPVLREPGQVDHVVVTFVDITGRKLAEDALQRSEFLRRTVMENFPNGVVGLFDRDLRYVLIDGTNTVTATDPHAWLGRTLQELTPPEVLPLVEPAYRAALAGETRRVQLPLGGHWIDVVIRPIRNAAGEVVQGLFMTQDVTEKRALEEQLVVASRLAALGTLVAGVAHEINNPLTGELASQGFAIEEIEAVRGLLRSGEELDRASVTASLEEALDALRDAQAGGQRISRIVKDLSTFGRPDPRRSRIRIMEVVEDAMRWLPASISGSTSIRVEDQGAPDVLASPGQIGQVFVNLVTNASKSMVEGRRGVVTVVVGAGRPGMARLEVRDDGAGIAPDVLKRIFDPFFTTRKVGEGTGLGLPICHSIVAAHGGTILASSTPGQGSTFRVELPAVSDGA
ncbi:MAG: domain S-box [Anaeromyxobacteraceae bacterium]|nr:domain S-box [Anaeromyxobacteraceae bacterium]